MCIVIKRSNIVAQIDVPQDFWRLEADQRNHYMRKHGWLSVTPKRSSVPGPPVPACAPCK